MKKQQYDQEKINKKFPFCHSKFKTLLQSSCLTSLKETKIGSNLKVKQKARKHVSRISLKETKILVRFV